mmetsp:Transcript_6529/g.6668  ORF Transcript_6529/g.6668 Transcript_6529/m.6668 type:complete len:568 (+) Transcript_6529:245-1948(+)
MKQKHISATVKPVGAKWRVMYSTIFIVILAISMNLSLNYIPVLLLIDSFLDNGEDFNLNRNIFLSGNYVPIDDEMINVNLNIVSGQIPASLSGVFLRVGPNEIPSHGFKKGLHWFDGHGMIHSIRITNETAKYSNEYIPTSVYTIEKNLGSNFFFRLGEFGGILGLFKALVLAPFKLSSTGVTALTRSHANTALNVFHDRIFAHEEVGFPFEIQLNRDLTFSAVGFETFEDQLNFPITAHPKVMSDGKMYFDGYNPVPTVGSSRKYGSVSKNTETTSFSLFNYFHVNTPVPAWAHDMAVTAEHVLFIESSVHFSLSTAMEGKFFEFNETAPLRVGLLAKASSSADDIEWYTAEKPYAIVHTLNAWSRVSTSTPETERTLDMAEASEETNVVLFAPIATGFSGDLYNGISIFNMAEITLNKHTKTISVEYIDRKFNVEFPRLHPAFLGKVSQYGYTGIQGDKAGAMIGFVKFDLINKSLIDVIYYGDYCIGGEPIVIPKEGEIISDNVYVSTFIHNESSNESYWVLYDGDSMGKETVVTLGMPRRVPYGFHGEWVGEDVLQRHYSRGD